MARLMDNLHFRLMAFVFRLRDLFCSPRETLTEVGIRAGDVVLDYGCGMGSHVLAAAELAREAGKVYAADVHPLAVRAVARAAAKKGLRNVDTICTDCATGLDNESVDVVLLYDVLHDLADFEPVLEELHRVLRCGGAVSVSDHHMKEEDIIAKIASTGLFRLCEHGEKTCKFLRQ